MTSPSSHTNLRHTTEEILRGVVEVLEWRKVINCRWKQTKKLTARRKHCQVHDRSQYYSVWFEILQKTTQICDLTRNQIKLYRTDIFRVKLNACICIFAGKYSF